MLHCNRRNSRVEWLWSCKFLILYKNEMHWSNQREIFRREYDSKNATTYFIRTCGRLVDRFDPPLATTLVTLLQIFRDSVRCGRVALWRQSNVSLRSCSYVRQVEWILTRPDTHMRGWKTRLVAADTWMSSLISRQEVNFVVFLERVLSFRFQS